MIMKPLLPYTPQRAGQAHQGLLRGANQNNLTKPRHIPAALPALRTLSAFSPYWLCLRRTWWWKLLQLRLNPLARARHPVVPDTQRCTFSLKKLPHGATRRFGKPLAAHAAQRNPLSKHHTLSIYIYIYIYIYEPCNNPTVSP